MRLFDLLISMISLTLLSPLLLLCAITLRLTGEGEVFYIQERIGKNQEPFKLLKFATMMKNSPNIGTGSITLNNDPRILKFGFFLRKTKINELPQLINVLVGDMSLIGPRPLTSDNFNLYCSISQNIISSVKPGLSGIGSIVFRDEEKFLTDHDNASNIYRDVISPFKQELEVWFVRNASLRLYFILIFLTIVVVLIPGKFKLWHFLPSLPSPSPNLSAMLR